MTTMEIANKTVYLTEDLRALVELTHQAVCLEIKETRKKSRQLRPDKFKDDYYPIPGMPKLLRVGYYNPKPKNKNGSDAEESGLIEPSLPVSRRTGWWDRRPRLGIVAPEKLPLPPLLRLAHASTDDSDGLERCVPENALREIVESVSRIFKYIPLGHELTIEVASRVKLRFRSEPNFRDLDKAKYAGVLARRGAVYERINDCDDQIEKAEERILKVKSKRDKLEMRAKKLEEKRDKLV